MARSPADRFVNRTFETSGKPFDMYVVRQWTTSAGGELSAVHSGEEDSTTCYRSRAQRKVGGRHNDVNFRRV